LVLALPARAIQFDDGPGGATCHYFAAAARLSWEHLGGDWTDARGTAQGDTPFAQASVRTLQPVQSVTWDVTPLTAQWARGESLAGSLLLRAAPDAKGGSVNFVSRENPENMGAPRLVIKWDDGQTDHLKAAADTYFSCPTRRSLGSEALFKVGNGAALLVFPFEARQSRSVTSASLVLTSPKQYGRSMRIGVFAARFPAASPLEMADAGLSQGFDRDVGIERHRDVLYAQRFEDKTWQALGSDPSTRDSLLVVDYDNGDKFRSLDGKALAVTIRRDSRQALNHHLRFAEMPGGEPEEAYFRYYLRLGENWNPIVDGGKLPGFAGTYGRAGWGMRPADGYNGWSARGAFMRHRVGDQNTTTWRGVGTYAYTASTKDISGELWGWNLGPTGRLQKNRWYSIEQHIRLNRPGAKDGVLQVWLDGQLAFQRTDLHFRDTTALKIESVWLNVYHGGTAVADRDLTLYMDNLVVARSYIGPGKFPR
jgi:hypothetical protein